VPQAGYVNAITRERLSWDVVKTKATLLSTALVHQCGLRPGETVSLFSTNSIWYPVAMWAVVRVGGRINGASPAYNVEEMTYALRTAKSRVLITLPGSLDVALAAAKEAGIPRERVFLLEGEEEGFVSVQDLVHRVERDGGATVPPWRIPKGMTNKEVCGYLNFSSGTTGLPKAVSLYRSQLVRGEKRYERGVLTRRAGHALAPQYHRAVSSAATASGAGPV
jgi:4-coumarate--CoA ligase